VQASHRGRARASKAESPCITAGYTTKQRRRGLLAKGGARAKATEDPQCFTRDIKKQERRGKLCRPGASFFTFGESNQATGIAQKSPCF